MCSVCRAATENSVKALRVTRKYVQRSASHLQRRGKCDSVHITAKGIGPIMRNVGSGERLKQSLALIALLLLTGFAVAGPTGVLAWSENATALVTREAQVTQLTQKRDALRNRVMLLDPEAADPDLASELVREQLGVMREDELVITLGDE